MKTRILFLSFVIMGFLVTVLTSCNKGEEEQAALVYGSVADIDGNVYKTIGIGTQTWMAENLKTTKFNDGTAIPFVQNATTWGNLSTPAYCQNSNYGFLYTWYTVNTGKLCPIGWHSPSDTEWTTLTTTLGGVEVAGTKMKSTDGWAGNIGKGDNSSGFSALPGGGRYVNGLFYYQGIYGSWWSSTTVNAEYASSWKISSDVSYVGIESDSKKYGLSVRCVKD